MAYQGTFVAGQTLTASELNGYGNVTVLRQNSLSVPNTTNTFPAFNIEDIDVSGWHTGTNGYLTVDVDGIFLLTATARNLNGTTRGLLVIRQGASSLADMDVSGGRDLTTSVVVGASAGTQFDMFVWQQSGSTQTPDVRLSCQLVRAT
jgi:hypothetical protein